ncbi:MAG TPA: hypothetical protein VJR02_23595 [Pyrinomonadaceae bacterium]|nr:hypothetical protein [Pyrinomonadaceae bacterium]
MRSKSQTNFGVVLIAFVAVVSFASVILYINYGDTFSTSNQNAAATPTPLTGNTNSSAAASQANTSPPQANANSEKPEDKAVNTLITGIAKKEGTGEAVTGAVVTLFNGDKRGAVPQSVDGSGKFQFENIPLKSGTTYSLQTKVPGLCGEEVFTSDAINAQRVYKDIILKPCQSQAAIVQTPTPETPGLARISDGLNGIPGPLNSIKGWLQTLAITWISTILLLLTVLGLIIYSWRPRAEDREGVRRLYIWKDGVDANLTKLNHPREKETIDVTLPADISQKLQQLVAALTSIAANSDATAGKSRTGKEAQTRKETQQRDTKSSPPPPESQSQTLQGPLDWYRRLLQGEATSPNPLFVEIDGNLSDSSVLVSNRRIVFNETQNHGSFVILSELDFGWIFPSPRSNFTADHHKVFDDLNQRNFEQQRINISPKKVKLQDGSWELTL